MKGKKIVGGLEHYYLYNWSNIRMYRIFSISDGYNLLWKYCCVSKVGGGGEYSVYAFIPIEFFSFFWFRLRLWLRKHARFGLRRCPTRDAPPPAMARMVTVPHQRSRSRLRPEFGGWGGSRIFSDTGHGVFRKRCCSRLLALSAGLRSEGWCRR